MRRAAFFFTASALALGAAEPSRVAPSAAATSTANAARNAARLPKDIISNYTLQTAQPSQATQLRMDSGAAAVPRLSQTPTTISHTGTRMNPKNPSGVKSEAPMTIDAQASEVGSIPLRR